MEYFELTFFCPREMYRAVMDAIIKSRLANLACTADNTRFDVLDGEGTDYTALRVCLGNLIFTKENCARMIGRLSRYVSAVYREIKEISFATGIYELTGYYCRRKQSLTELNRDFMRKFPLAFYRTGEDFSPGITAFTDGNVTCIFHEGAQNLW